MGVCSYGIWQYREEGIGECSRRNLLKNAVSDVDGIVVVGDVGGGIGWELCFWCARRDW